MIGAFEAESPSVGIFWQVEFPDGHAKLLTAGCSLIAGEPYGEFLTFPDGHYEIWERWRRAPVADAQLRRLVREFEYEYWPRGRIVFDRSRKSFILYADRKLMTAATLAAIKHRFCLPEDRTSTATDFHYQSSWEGFPKASPLSFS